MCQKFRNEGIATDGKALRRSLDQANGKSALHRVNVFSQPSGLILAQQASPGKQNEIRSIQEILKWLDLQGTTVTLDAMGCQKSIAQQIDQKRGCYILQLKANHRLFLELAQYEVSQAYRQGYFEKPGNFFQTQEQAHGREEVRRYSVFRDVDKIPDSDQWTGLECVIRVERERKLPGKEPSFETAYYLSNSIQEAETLSRHIRGHWRIENQLHWVLDIAFDEDHSRIRKGQAAYNFAVIRQIAFNLLKRETTNKRGMKAKRKKAGWDRDYLLKVLAA